MDKICSFGCGQIAIKQFTTGNFCCSQSTNSCPSQKLKNGTGVKKHIATFDNPNDRWPNGHPKPHKGKPAHNKGKTNITRYGADQASQIRNKHRKTISGINFNDKRSNETNIIVSNRMSIVTTERHAAGWDNKAGRCKKIKYSSSIAGDVTLDGSWELVAAQYFDFKSYNWRRNKTRFPYFDINGKQRNYTPDFLVEEMDGYVEVKGYETELDRAKWKNFPHKLTVLRKEHIKNMQGEVPERTIGPDY